MSRFPAFISALGVFLFLSAVVAWLDPLGRNNDPGSFEPLYGYDVQQVEGDNFSGDDIVKVTGTKCSEVPVTVIGDLSWARRDPRGEAVELGEGTAQRDAGCTEFTFANTIPPEVQRITNDLDQPVVWQIVGHETPVVNGPRRPVTVTFQSEPFTIVPVGE